MICVGFFFLGGEGEGGRCAKGRTFQQPGHQQLLRNFEHLDW